MNTAEDLSRFNAELHESFPPGHNCFCAATMRHGNELLVLWYWPDYKKGPDLKTLRFPGETSEKDDESPIVTLHATVTEEILSKDESSVAPSLVSWELVHREVHGHHTKYFFVVEMRGALRSTDLFEGPEETEHGTVTNERLSPPFLMRADEVARIIYPSHARALEQIARRFEGEDIAFSYALNALEQRKNGSGRIGAPLR